MENLNKTNRDNHSFTRCGLVIACNCSEQINDYMIFPMISFPHYNTKRILLFPFEPLIQGQCIDTMHYPIQYQ